MKLAEIIEKLKETEERCKIAEYSLDDVRTLRQCAEALKREAQLLYECCT